LIKFALRVSLLGLLYDFGYIISGSFQLLNSPLGGSELGLIQQALFLVKLSKRLIRNSCFKVEVSRRLFQAQALNCVRAIHELQTGL
jgi:hypothetical protein